MKKRVFYPLLIGLVVLVSAASYKSDFFVIAQQIEIFTDAYKRLNMDYVDEVNPVKMMDVAIKSMFEQLDPYTNYWNAQDIQESRLRQSGNYTGVGAVIQNQRDGILVKEVFKDFPADNAGLRAGDQIVKIGDIAVKDFDQDAGELLTGSPGSTVGIEYLRQGEIHKANLKRERRDRKTVPFSDMYDDEIGYIRLSEFGETASLETGDALKGLKAKGAQKIILDLRGNPGGLLEEAVNVSNLFLPRDQLIVYTESMVEKYNRTYLTQQNPVDTEIPVVVLIDGNSASASEIVSGSLQDLDRGVVVGARSFGKGLVQRVRPLKYGTQMKLTISRYFTPSGRGIQAMDYQHKDKEGNAVKAKKEDYKAFKTKNGRTVYDAGGIAPDIKVEESEFSDITRALLEQNVIFDFVTDYYYSHKLENFESFKFTDDDFTSFKSYLKKIDFDYQTPTEIALTRAFEQSADDELKQKIQKDYQHLMKRINQVKTDELDENKVQIVQQLSDEIIKRYFYEDGFYKYSLKNNQTVLKAAELLKNEAEYKAILSGK